VTPLEDLVPPPPDPPPVAEADRRLPPDYVALASTYGPGRFDEFVWLLAPGARNPDLDLERQATTRLQALRDTGEEIPYDPLVPFAFTDNGDVVYWHAEGEPHTWKVVANESRGPEWFTFDGTATEFLHATLSGAVRVPFFPEDYPSDEPDFTPAT
jgi:hypothetical protein